jgi:holo-[acyl-carrier protein] synthase
MVKPPEGAVRGVGLDLVSVSRFRGSLDRWGRRLLDRLFTPSEQSYCLSKGRPEIHLAGRFAAKEALMKAIGTGFARGIRFSDIEILPAGGGPPKIALHGQALVISYASQLSEFHLSITHSGDYAAACVIATGVESEDPHGQQGI